MFHSLPRKDRAPGAGAEAASASPATSTSDSSEVSENVDLTANPDQTLLEPAVQPDPSSEAVDLSDHRMAEPLPLPQSACSSLLQQPAEPGMAEQMLDLTSSTDKNDPNITESANTEAAETGVATDAAPDQGEYTIKEGPINTVGIVIQDEVRDAITYDSEDDQRGPEIKTGEQSFFSLVDANVFKHRAAISINNVLYCDQLDFQDISAAIFFRFPDKNRGAVILSFRLPRSMNHMDNEAQQEFFTLQLEIPSQTINPESIIYAHLPSDATQEQLSTLFQPRYDTLRQQIGEDGTCNFINISLKTSTCLATSGNLPKLRTKELDDKFRALIQHTASCNTMNPMHIICVAEGFGTLSQEQYTRFNQHMTSAIAKDPIAAWFKETPYKNILNVGNLTSPQERPEVPVQRARLVFEDHKAYQLPHAYCAASEQEFRDRKAADFLGVNVEAKFQEMTSSKPTDGQPRAYIAYFDVGTAKLEKPVPGDTVWVQLPFEEPKAGPEFPPQTGTEQMTATTEKQIDANTAEEEQFVDAVTDHPNSDLRARGTQLPDRTDESAEYDEYGADLAYEEDYDMDPEDVNEESLNLWKGTVIENTLTPPGYISMIVERKLEPKKLSVGLERPYVSTNVPALTDNHKTLEDYRLALETAPTFLVKLFPDHNRQVFKDEIRSLDNFHRAEHCKSKVEYFLGKTVLAKNKDVVTDLHSQLGPVNAHENFTPSQLAFRENLKEVRENIILLTGAYGTGKTDVALRMALELQSNETVTNKLLYTSASNKAVDDAAQRYQVLCDQYGLQKDIIRVYNLKSEKAATLNNFKDKKPNSRFVATLTDTFLKEFQAASYIKGLQDEYTERKERGDPRRTLIDMSLMHRMVQQIKTSNDANLRNLLHQLLEYGKNGLGKEEMIVLKLRLHELMSTVLTNADAVFCTLNMSSKHNLFTNFRASFVIIDESCRASEISTLAPFAFYEAQAYLLVGDPRQLRPVLFSAEQEKHGSKVTQNSWYRQGLLPLHKRLDEIGHPVCYLREQHRCQGNISIYPSTRFYHGLIKNANPTVPRQAQAITRHLRTLGIRTTTNVMFLAIHDSKADKENGTESWCNPDHVEVATRYIEELLRNADFEGRTGRPGSVTITAMYKAQVALYQRWLLRLSGPDQKRVQARTVDAMQGYEDDAIFLDLVNSFRPGYTGEPHRLNVALTRARYLLVVMFNPRMIHDDAKAERHPATRELFKLFDYADKKRLIVDVEAPNRVCHRCKLPGHSVKNCPEPDPAIVCRNCGGRGHKAKDCGEPRQPRCKMCGEIGHTKRDCPKTQCRNCDKLGHVKDDCKEPLNMTKVKCLLCTDMGHFKKDCPFKEGLTSAKFTEIKLRQREAATTSMPEASQPGQPTAEVDLWGGAPVIPSNSKAPTALAFPSATFSSAFSTPEDSVNLWGPITSNSLTIPEDNDCNYAPPSDDLAKPSWLIPYADNTTDKGKAKEEISTEWGEDTGGTEWKEGKADDDWN